MIQIYGLPGEEWGDQYVYQALEKLSGDYVIYAQPKLVDHRESRYPDYVLVNPDLGVIVLEVKDWVHIADRDRKRAQVRRSNNGNLVWETSPVEQARSAAQLLSRMLQSDPDLCDFAGRLDFAYAYAGVLPHQPTPTITWLEEAWGQGLVFGRDDLQTERLAEKLAKIPVPFRKLMSENQVRAVCTIIDARNRVVDRNTGAFKGVYSREQEAVAKEPIAVQVEDQADKPQSQQASFFTNESPTIKTRIESLEAEMSAEAAAIKQSAHIRLVRGFAGTGKTDVLVLRAYYLYENYPSVDILVTTFNRPVYEQRLQPELARIADRVDVQTFDTLCSAIYKHRHNNRWIKPQDTRGMVACMAEDLPHVKEFGLDFLADEFIWMKEIGRTTREQYVGSVREGRGGAAGRMLSARMKNTIFDLFESYQDYLAELPAHDWVDLHDKVLKYLRSGVEPDKGYDLILVDEAQHFAPNWMTILQHFLKPDGSLFICDDPSQSVYRYFSWRQKGVDVVGRTRWLKVPYRNTRQIFQAAYSLIENNDLAQSFLKESGEQVLPDIDNPWMRQGSLPQVHRFDSAADEQQFVIQEVGKLIQQEGLLPVEIGILHHKKYVLDRYRRLLPEGVQFNEIKRQTGLEYKALFLPQLQELLERDAGLSWQEDKARQQLTFYMSITRARDHVYLLFQQKWPGILDPIKPFVEWNEH